MATTLEPAQADRELEHKHSSSTGGQSAVLDASAHPLGGISSALGVGGSDERNSKLISSPLLQRRASGALRALVMRSAQQSAGNQRLQGVFAQLRSGSGSTPVQLQRHPLNGAPPTPRGHTLTLVLRHCACGGTCSSCGSTEPPSATEEEEQKVVQRQAASQAAVAPAEVIPSDSAGQPLDDLTRSRMENRLGGDFGDVRVHTDTASGESATALAANAYTVGQDVYFAPGQYQPHSMEGGKLLAHELTHTQQQAAGEAPSEALPSRDEAVLIGAPDDPLEREAEDQAEAFAHGESGGAVTRDPEGAVRRDSKPWTLADNPLTKAVAGGVEAAGGYVGDLIERFAPGATTFFHGLREYFDEALSKGVDSLFGGILSSVKEKGIAGTLEAMIGSAASGIFKSVGAFVAGKCAALGELAEHLAETASKLGGQAFEQVKKGFDLIKEKLEDIWTQYGAPALDWVKNKLGAVWKRVEDTAKRFWDWLKPLRDRAEAIWDKVTSFLIQSRRRFQEWLEVIVPKAIDAWEALKAKIKPHMEQIKTAAKVAGVIVLLFSPAGPLVIVGGVIYLIYLGVKAVWDKWGKPLAHSIRQWWVEEALPSLEKGITDLKAKVASAKAKIEGGLQQLYDVFMKVLEAAGVLSFLASVKAAIQSVAAKIEAFKNKIQQKLDEWLQKIAALLAAAAPYLRQIREFLRQTLLVALVGPMAFLDDGVWKTINMMVGLAMRTPCIRELASLLRVPALLERLGRVRDGIKQGWETIRNPGPLLEKFKASVQPLVAKIEPEVRSRVSGLFEAYTEREIFIQVAVMYYLADSLKRLGTTWWSDLKNIGWTLLWPWDEVGKEFMPMLSAFGDAISALFNLEISKAIDSFLDGMKKFNGIAGALSGWFMLASVLIGAALGALGFAFGPAGVATVGAGATAGWEFAEGVGLTLLAVAVATELAIMGKKDFDLRFQNPRIADKNARDKKDQEDCKAIAGSVISLATIGALMLLGSIASKFAKFLYGLVEDVPLVSDIAEFLKSAKEKVGDFSFKKKGAGEPGEGEGARGGLDDPAAKAEQKGIPREQFERELNQIREKVADPNNVRQPADPRYDAEIDVKDGAEDHTYDRDKADRTACRGSGGPVCDLDLGSDVNSKIDEALEKKSAKKTKETPADTEGLTPEEAALKQRPDVQKLLQRTEEKGLPGTEKEILDYIAGDPETRIAEMNKSIDIREATAEAQNAVGTAEKVDVPSEETGTRGMQVREAHDIGVAKGREAAQALDKLTPSNWENPLGHRGGFGQGFDDIMFKPNGDPVVVEYKGGSAELGTGQLSREWVQRNIDLLREAGDTAMADRLQAALDAGKLEGRVYRTPLDADGHPLPTMRDPPITYPPQAPSTPPVAQPSRRDTHAEPDGGFLVETAGQPLDRQTRAFMEPRLESDFSDVRVHTDARAAESADSLGAVAYTAGRDIYFAAGQYAPGSHEGQHLLAHELAHTIQQQNGFQPAVLSAGARGGVAISRPDDPLEYEAEHAADSALSSGTENLHALGRSSGSVQLSHAPGVIIQRKTKLATVLNPTPVGMTVGIDGISFDVPPEFSYVAGPKSLQLTALMLGRLAGPQYTPALAEQVDAYLQSSGYRKQGGFKGAVVAKDGEKPESVMQLALEPSVKLIEFLQKKKVKVQLDADQANTLIMGIANTSLWLEVKHQAKEINFPLPAWYNEAFFTAEMSSQGALLRQYTVSRIRFEKTGDQGAQSEGRNVALEILSQILDGTDVLEEIRKDTSLAKIDKINGVYGGLFKLPKPVPDPLPVPTQIQSFELATLFLGYVRTQKKLSDEAIVSTEARVKLLKRFAGFTEDLAMRPEGKPGAVRLREVPASANYPPFPSTVTPTPNLSGPLFDAALGTDHLFTMQIQFPDVYSALGRYNFHWERVRIPDDKIGKPVDIDKLPGEEATTWEVVSVRFGRATRYAKEDIAATIADMQTDLGDAGIGALTLVGANAILRYVGEGLKMAIESLTTPLNAKHIVFPSAGLYMVRGIMAPVLEGDEAVVRVPSVAYFPVLAREPEEMAKGGVKAEVDRRARAKDRVAEIDKKLNDDKSLADQDRKALIKERDGLKASLGSLTDILKSREEDIKERIADVKAGKDQGDLEALQKQQAEIEKTAALRTTRKTEGGELLISSFASDLGQKIALQLEVVDRPKTGDTYHVYVSDVTTPKSGAESGSGKTRNDAIRAAVKEILGGISGYGRGYVSLLLDGNTETLRIAASKGALLMEAVENVAMALSVAAIAAAPFTAGASMVLLIPAGIAGAAPSAYRVYKKIDAGIWEWNLENAMDLVNIAASLIGAGRAASASLKWVRVSRALLIVGYGVEGLNGVLLGADIMTKIDELSKLEKGQREAALMMLLGQTLLQAGVMVGGKLAERAQQQRMEGMVRDLQANKAPSGEEGPRLDVEKGKIVEPPPSIDSKVGDMFAAATKEEQMAKLGPMDEESRKRLEENAELRKALAESELAARMLKKCASSCFPENMTAEQVQRLERLLRSIRYMGGDAVNEGALKEYLYKRRETLDNAIARLEAADNAGSLNAWLDFYNTRGEEKIIHGPKPEEIRASYERKRVAYEHGEKFGRKQADADGIRDVGFENPIKRGAFEQGFDDVRKKGGLPDTQLDNGDVYIVEYKGAGSHLAPGQGELDWVVGNIRRLYREGGQVGRELAPQLARALREGRLKGIAYSTPMTEPTSVIKTWDYGKVRIKL